MIGVSGFEREPELWTEFEKRILPALGRAMQKRFGSNASPDTIASGAWSALLGAAKREDWTPNLDDPFWGMYHLSYCRIIDRIRRKKLDRREPMLGDVEDLSAEDPDTLADGTIGSLIEEVASPPTPEETNCWEGLLARASREEIAGKNGWDIDKVDALIKGFKSRLTPDEWVVWDLGRLGVSPQEIARRNQSRNWTLVLVENMARQIRRKFHRRFDPYLDEFRQGLSEDERVVWDQLRTVDLEGKRADEKIAAVAARLGLTPDAVRTLAIAVGRRLSRFYVDRLDR